MDENNGPVLLVDAYNVFARAYCVVPTMSSNGHHFGGTVGFLKSLGVYAEKFKPSKIIVCWEGGGSARRRKILPEYKLNRKPIKLNRSEIYEDLPNTEENFKYQITQTIKLLNTLPVHQMYVNECEADDIIAYIARYKFQNRKKIIVSMDQDLHQLLGKNCVQYSPASKKILDENYVLQRYGVTVENFVTARSFIGDTSDGIPGIKGAGFKSLAKRFPELSGSEFVSVDDILSRCSDLCLDKPLKMFKQMLDHPDTARRNWKLMYLDIDNLSAEHIKNLEYGLENYEQNRDKLNLMRMIISEGIDIPRGLDVDRLYMRINSVVTREE